MSIAGLNFQTWTMTFVAGLNQKSDPRALQAPELTIAKDIEYVKIGGIRTRYPYAALGAGILGGGTISDARILVENGNELLLFTKAALYSWNAQLSKWVLKGTHLAVKVDEETKFSTTGDQADADRAELSNTIVYAWADSTNVYVAAVDKTTGSVLLAPTQKAGEARARLVALSTKILLFTSTAVGLVVRAIDPADVATGVASAATTVLAIASFNGYFDATRVLGTDTAVVGMRRQVTTSYEIATVTAGLSIATSTKARTCDGPIAVSSSPTGTQVQVVRANGGNIQGDLITVSTLADVFTGQAVGTASGTVNQIAAAHRSVQDGGAYRCYAFWSSGESAAASFLSRSNWVDTANSLGTEAAFVYRLGVASRAFDHDGRVFVSMIFAGESSFSGANASAFRAQLQNTYFLYRDDAFLTAKAAFQRAGGLSGGSSVTTGRLPGVVGSGGVFTWVGTERRVIDLGANQSGYGSGARSPREVTYTFDSNGARRCARLGQTLYVAGGEILQYDGVQLTEVGFHIYPWSFGAIEVPAGNVADGTYALKCTLRWDNARGELDRSTTATVGTITIAAGPNGISIPAGGVAPLFVTHKANIAVEVWRTAVSPGEDAPFYLATSKDPAATTNPNRYLVNDTTGSLIPAFNDELADASLTVRESSPENGASLENLVPPAASIIVASPDRLFLAGIAGEPGRVRYSKQRQNGEVASFHDALAVDLPPTAGAITALAFNGETLAVFTSTGIWALDGQGFTNTSDGSNYVPRLISVDIGAVSQEAVATTDRGVVLKSSKGWYLLNRGWGLDYIGGPVCDYDNETPLSIDVIESQHQVRILTASRMLVFDTLASDVLQRPVWSEWTVSDGVHSCIWNGTHTYLTSTGPKTQQTTYALATYGMDVELAFLRIADLMGEGKVDEIQILGEYRSAHSLRVSLADGDGVYFQVKNWTPSPTTVGGPLRVKHRPSIKQLGSLKVRLTATPDGAGESLRLTGLAFRFGAYGRTYGNLAAAQKQ